MYYIIPITFDSFIFINLSPANTEAFPINELMKSIFKLNSIIEFFILLVLSYKKVAGYKVRQFNSVCLTY